VRRGLGGSPGSQVPGCWEGMLASAGQRGARGDGSGRSAHVQAAVPPLPLAHGWVLFPFCSPPPCLPEARACFTSPLHRGLMGQSGDSVGPAAWHLGALRNLELESCVWGESSVLPPYTSTPGPPAGCFPLGLADAAGRQE